MQSENNNIEQSYRTMTIIWFALLVTQVLWLLFVFIRKRELFKFDFSKPFLDGENSILVIVLAVAGITTFLVSFVMRSKLLKQAVDNQNVGLVQRAMIIGCALCEVTALCGLVLAFTFYQYFFLWFALGILGIILHFPQRENVIAASYKKM